MNDDNTLTISPGEMTETTGEEWKNDTSENFDAGTKAVTENERADLSPEETLEVDNWLLGQGIDSGNKYVEKLSEAISKPEEPISDSAEQTAEQKIPAAEAESEIISPKVIEYLETQEPESVLNSISTMTDAELDRTVELIETGKVEQIEQILEKKHAVAEIGDTVENIPANDVHTVEKKQWETDPSLPNFAEIDKTRREELKSLIKEHRDAKRASPETRTEAEKISPKNKTITETEKKASVSKETPPTETEIKSAATVEVIQKNTENREKQKSSGVVAYDIPPEALLKDVKIVLVKRPPPEGWMLPQAILEDTSDEKKETEEKIEEKYGLEIKIDEKLGNEKKTLIKTDSSEITLEKSYYMAESDSTKKLRDENMQWVTLADVQSNDFELTEKDLEIIANAAVEIKEKMEKAEPTNGSPAGQY